MILSFSRLKKIITYGKIKIKCKTNDILKNLNVGIQSFIQ